jgi:leucyl aminopeptidase
MNIQIKNNSRVVEHINTTLISTSLSEIHAGILKKEELSYIKSQLKTDPEKHFFHINRLSYHLSVCLLHKKEEDIEYIAKEKNRKLGSQTFSFCKTEKMEHLQIVVSQVSENDVFDFLEGLLLASYTFDKYKSVKKEKPFKNITISGTKLSSALIKEITSLTQSVFTARNWVNEPGSSLTPSVFVKHISEMFSTIPLVKTEILSPKKISSLKMAGIEAVSKGGPNPPAFIILEYIPEKLKKQQPFILIGKGIFFDTGGINLKPGTGLSDMKCDMSGAAAVASAIHLIASQKLNIPVVGLIPCTENRPGNLAYLPGDVLTMMNGVSVEIKNTDAEGRLILADALCYAKKYNPAFAITIATLTGMAHATFGSLAIAGMHEDASMAFSLLKSASFDVYERIAELPMWQEYETMIESQVADIQNVGGKYAGTITAAKFLHKFTDYPFIHLDIAGPAFTEKADSYIPSGGTGVGVRLFYAFFRKLSLLQK